VPGVCRALVLIPADKHIREGSFQPRLELNPELVPTGLLPVWREHNRGTNRASTGMVRVRRIPAGLLPAWQEQENVNRVSTGMTGYQPGFHRCGKREQREQQINRASTGVMAEFLRRRLQPGFYRCGPGLRGNLGRVFRTPFLDPLSGNHQHKQRRYTNRLVNRVSTDVTAKMRGLRSRLGWSLFIDPPAVPPM
jgi:hypothetical protein